jgi:apoptosis-inducing factor 2
MGGNTTKEKKHLVIVGGSFAGIFLIYRLSSTFKITLIDKKEFFEWSWAVPHSYIGDPRYFAHKATVDFHQMIDVDKVYGNDASFTQGILDELVNDNAIKIKRTKGRHGNDLDSVEAEEIHFDYLAICTGSIYSINEDPDDIFNIFSKADRESLFNKYRANVERAKSVLVVGGGPTGIETVGEILMNYGTEKSLGIITNGESLLSGYPTKATRLAQNHFEKKKVKVYLNKRYDPGQKLDEDYDFVINWVGTKFNSNFLDKHYKDFKDGKGRIFVNKYFQVCNMNPCELPKDEHIPKASVLPNIFCYGDACLTRMNEIKNIPVIREMSYIVAHNLTQLSKDRNTLKEMPYGTDFVSGVYFDKWAGAMVMNRCVMNNWCQFKNKQGFEEVYYNLMNNKCGGKCNFWMYNCQLNCMGCCFNVWCCCSGRKQRKERREELKRLFKEEV